MPYAQGSPVPAINTALQHILGWVKDGCACALIFTCAGGVDGKEVFEEVADTTGPRQKSARQESTVRVEGQTSTNPAYADLPAKLWVSHRTRTHTHTHTHMCTHTRSE